MPDQEDQKDQKDHHDQRREYAASTLSREMLPADPLTLFGSWLDQAVSTGATDATAMALATADSTGAPSVRIVLLKEHGPAGFVWFTDYGSQKGQELDENPRASLAFYWRDFARQVRVSGTVTPVGLKTSRAYFETRPADSRFSAAASDQSQPIPDRLTLEERVAALRAKHPDEQVPMPEGWGGYCLKPQSIEFWQGREGRLHDRFRYKVDGDQVEVGDQVDGDWEITRLQP